LPRVVLGSPVNFLSANQTVDFLNGTRLSAAWTALRGVTPGSVQQRSASRLRDLRFG
jgi:hypothetical protein